MAKLRQNKWSMWVALCVAYLVAAQLMLSGFANGAHAAHVQRDVFGNVLCVDHSDASSPADKSGESLCCTLGCGASQTFVDTPPIASLLVLQNIERRSVYQPVADQTSGPRPYTPRHTRAPPPNA